MDRGTEQHQSALGVGVLLVGAPAAFAGTVTSPTGMVTVSGPSPIQSGVATTYTMTVTNTTSSPFDGATDLQVTGSSNNGSPSVGSTFTYTFQVKDNGPLAASDVTFDDALPAATVLGGTPSTDNGTCAANPATNSVHCDLGSLPVGQQSDITFTASPTATGPFADTATVAMTNPDTRPANGSVAVTVRPR